jgi:potassium efflux system protein
VRVGDTVTVGGTSGTVTRIRIRATTITDWDRKELLIPNKEFVTGQIVNWTLTDTIMRIVIPVGVAYGSDTRRAREILVQLADENTRVLQDPKPRALFLGFGDSVLNLDLRAYVANLEDLLPAKDELHTAIDEAFKKAGIEIAFPQQDIHIRTIGAALPLRDDRRDGRPGAAARKETPEAPSRS